VVANWERDKKMKDDRVLREVEEALEVLYNSEGFGYLSEEHKIEVKSLEDKRRIILLEKEKEWRLKSRALWLQVGDENTKFFHRYANCRKNINSIWKIDKGDGTWATNFKDMAFEGVNHFSSLFKISNSKILWRLWINVIVHVVKILDFISSYFQRYSPWKTRFVTNHEINYLGIFVVKVFSEVSKSEISKILS
jgi:hypothetical protein